MTASYENSHVVGVEFTARRVHTPEIERRRCNGVVIGTLLIVGPCNIKWSIIYYPFAASPVSQINNKPDQKLLFQFN